MSALLTTVCIVMVGLPIVWLAEKFALNIANRMMGHSGECNHMFPERGIGCRVCDEYHWHSDKEDMQTLDDRLARIEEAVFPLEPNRRIWVEGAHDKARGT